MKPMALIKARPVVTPIMIRANTPPPRASPMVANVDNFSSPLCSDPYLSLPIVYCRFSPNCTTTS